MEKELNENNKQSAVLLMAKGKDGENTMVVDTMRIWAINHGCKIIFEGPAKYDENDCAIHYCKMLDHPIYPELSEYITSGLSWGMIVVGTKEQLRELKRSVGKPVNPAPDTLRGKLFAKTGRTEDKNFVHCSDVDELDFDGNSLAMIEIANYKNVYEKTHESDLKL